MLVVLDTNILISALLVQTSQQLSEFFLSHAWRIAYRHLPYDLRFQSYLAQPDLPLKIKSYFEEAGKLTLLTSAQNRFKISLKL
jgi:hypothetical protein